MITLSPRPPEHLYIHWPFCASKCTYCDFVALIQHEDFFERYHKALCHEIEIFAQSYNDKLPIKTIFLGGGTPSLYPLNLLEELFEKLHDLFDMHSVQEITIESNPADINQKKLAYWQSLGINRLSMGVQVLDNTVMHTLKRHQTTNDVLQALALAPNFFSNISCDLIIGLPGVSKKTWDFTLTTIVQAPIKHISLYFLTIHEKTQLFFALQNQTLSLPEQEDVIQIYRDSIDYVKQHNLFQYEISNFANPGYESIHNQAYWNRKSYQGIGLSAASFDGVIRTTNHNNIEKYLQSIEDEDRLPISSVEQLTQEQHLTEVVMLSLRQKKGLDLHSVLYWINGEKKAQLQRNLSLLIEHGYMQIEDERICLTSNGIMCENEVVIKLLEQI